jgi:hypothetical protein
MAAKEARAGGAYVEVSLRSKVSAGAKQVQRELNAVSNSLNTFGSTLGKIGVGIATAGILSAAAFVPAISAAGDFNEIVSKFDTVFGDQAKSVRAWANEYGNAVGRSERQLLQMLGTAQDTFVPLGFNPKEAEEFSKQVAKLAIDLASFNNMADEEAFERLISSVVGNSENLRAFGVVAQDAQIKAEAFAMGLDPKNLTAQQKALVILNLAMKGTSAAQGDAERTADSYANQMKALNAELENTKIAIGSALIGPVTTVVAKFREVTKAVSSWAKSNPGLVQSLAGISVAVVAIGGVISTAGVAITGFGMAVGSLATIASTVASAVSAIGALAGVTTLAGAAAAAMAAIFNPITWIVLGIAAAVGVLAAALSVAAVTSGVAGDAIEYIKRAFSGLSEIASTTFGGISDALAAGDMQLAAKILFAGLKVAFLSGLQELTRLFMNQYAIIGNATARIVSELARLWISLPMMIANGISTVAFNVAAVLDTDALTNAKQELALLTKEAAMIRDRRAAAAEADAGKGSTPAATGDGTPTQSVEAKDAYDAKIKSLREEVAAATLGADAADLLTLAHEGLTDAQLAEVAALQAQRRELKAKQDAEEEAARIRKQAAEDLIAEGKQLAESLRTPREAFVSEVARIEKLLDAKAIDQTTADRALAKAREDLAGGDRSAGQNTLATRGSAAAFDTIRRNQSRVSAETWVTPLLAQGMAAIEVQRKGFADVAAAAAQRNDAMDLSKLESLSEKQLTALGISQKELVSVKTAIEKNKAATYTIP